MSTEGQDHPQRKKPPQGPTQTRKGRAAFVIDGTWRFATDAAKKGESEGWSSAPPAAATDTTVPSLWTSAAAKGYNGTAWYWRRFAIPADWKGQTIRVLFHAIAGQASVWLNGTSLGDHADLAAPFDFNVTRSIKIGADNLLAVRIEGDARRGAGIWQGVEVISHDEAYIQQVFVQADAFGAISADINLLNTSTVEGDAELDCVVTDMTGKSHEVKRSNQNLHLTPSLNVTTFNLSIPPKELTRWSPSEPKMYAFQLSFRQDKDVLDTDERLMGFRTLGFKDNHITLNGAAVSLSAIAPKYDLPVVIASTADTERASGMLRTAKSSGVSVLYLEAINPQLLALADTCGLLIIEGSRSNSPAAIREAEMRSLVLRDRSHPSVLGWNLGDCTAAFTSEVRQLDPSRFLITGTSEKPLLWAPNRDSPEKGPVPAGLLPLSH